MTRQAEILVVDDERIVRAALSDLLESHGYAVRTALNAEAARFALTARRPDLILLDVMMPGLDGYSFCAHLRKNCSTIPIVFLTAKDASADELRGFESGGDDFVSKSAPAEILLARIAAALRRGNVVRDDGGAFAFSRWEVRPSDGQLVSSDGATAHLQPGEVRALRRLAEQAGKPVSRTEMSELLCGTGVDDGALNTAISRLRAKFGHVSPIATVRNGGYSLAISSSRK